MPSHDPKKIADLRTKSGFTQQDLAEKTGLNKKTIENAEKESGAKKPTLDTLNLIATALGVTIEKLVKDSSDQLEYMQQIIDAIPLPCFVKDGDGIYRACNELFCNFLRRQRSAIIGSTVFQVAYDDPAKVYKTKDDVLFELGSGGTQIYDTLVEDKLMRFYKGVFSAGASGDWIIGVMVNISEFIASTNK